MRTLYHQWLSPSCRAVRIALAEKQLDFDLQIEKTWERRREFLRLNPAGDVPVLVEADSTAIVGATAILEFLDEVYPEPPLMPKSAPARAEVRRLIGWFDQKFHAEVTANLVGEKYFKRLMSQGQPASSAIRAGLANIHYHLEYIAYLSERRRWLGGEAFSLADIVAAAQLSTVDYLGDVPWAKHPIAKDWYARMKSRPSFRALLADRVRGTPPAAHYGDLDF